MPRLVDAGERLVEQEDRGLLGERTCEQHALELAARQRTDRPVAESGEPDALQRLGDHGAVVRTDPASEPASAHRDDFEHGDGEVVFEFVVLGDVAEREAMVAVVAHVPQQLHGPVVRDQPDDGLEQRRLARAVRPDDRDDFARRE